MTYEKVRDIIGSDGQMLSESGEKGTSLYTVTYSWDGEGSANSSAKFIFQNDQLKNKSQVGL